MLHYAGHAVSFQEVPDEISLVILIADCPHRCPGCHSPDLWKQTGIDLREKLPSLIEEYEDAISCVCFMGDGQDESDLLFCADYAQACGFKTAIYSGYYDAYVRYFNHFNYYKCGPYIKERGGLDNPGTNQFMLQLISENVFDTYFLDITERFQRSNN